MTSSSVETARESVIHTDYEESLNEYWEEKTSDDINLLLGESDGLYHHHFGVGPYHPGILDAPEDEREKLILKEMHRLENAQVSLLTDSLSHLTPRSRVMDGGSGRGGTSFVLHDRFGCAADGINFCSHHIEFANRLAERRGCADKVRFHYANMLNTPLADESVDAVVTNETTMYVDLYELFAEFARALRPGGRYVLVTWCANDVVEEKPRHVRQIDEHYICRTHRRSTYQKALLANGLVPSRVDDLTAQAIPYWELRSHSRLRTGVEDAFIDGYRDNTVNYLVVAAEKKAPAA